MFDLKFFGLRNHNTNYFDCPIGVKQGMKNKLIGDPFPKIGASFPEPFFYYSLFAWSLFVVTPFFSGADYGYGYKSNKIREYKTGVTEGSNTKLRCDSPRPMSGCKYRSPRGEVFNIGIGGGSSYDNARIDCLCTVRLVIYLNLYSSEC